MLRVLITSGATIEPIDCVRGITNFATGNLGKVVAEAFLSEGAEVTILAGLAAVVPPKKENLEIIRISDVSQLLAEMEKRVAKADVVVHSMAVSDYQPLYMSAFEELPENLTKSELTAFRPRLAQKKISSDDDYQLMVLKKTPKVIRQIKSWHPKVVLFGFKLLVGVTESELIRVALESLEKNQANFIIANDLEHVHGEEHQAFLIGQKQEITRLKTKTEIATAIVREAEREVENNV